MGTWEVVGAAKEQTWKDRVGPVASYGEVMRESVMREQ